MPSIYSMRSGITDINELRYSKFLEQCDASSGELLSSFDDVDMSIIPPSRDALKAHVKGQTIKLSTGTQQIKLLQTFLNLQMVTVTAGILMMES